MADMDLSGQNQLKHFWVIDEVTGLVTIDFTDVSGLTDLGVLTIEATRLRSLLDALGQVAQTLFPNTLDLTTREKHITQYNQQTGAGTTEFGS